MSESDGGDGRTLDDMPFGERILGPERYKHVSGMINFGHTFFVKPAILFRDKIVAPNRQESYWYHRRYRRVPTIDECYMHDWICRHEANAQMKRDKLVEENIVQILRERYNDCVKFNWPAVDIEDPECPCYDLKRTYLKAAANMYIKFGDLTFAVKAEDVLMKQKHRMIWERRNGKLPSEQGLDL